MKYVLNPVRLGAENLKTICVDSKVNHQIVLGRNIETGLDQPSYKNVQFVSRSHALIIVENEKVFLQPDPKQVKNVLLNGTVCGTGRKLLQIGDIMTLLGAVNYYNYEFVKDVSEFDPENISSKKRRTDDFLVRRDVINLSVETATTVVDLSKNSSNNSSSTISIPVLTIPEPVKEPSKSGDARAMAAKLLRQYECSICYETMACSFSLSPCGDSFCFVCIADWAQKHSSCPLCQTKFEMKSSMVSKLADNAIREVLSTDPEQLREWEGRAKEGLDMWKEQVLGVKAPQVAAPGPPEQTRSNTHLTAIQSINPNIATPGERISLVFFLR